MDYEKQVREELISILNDDFHCFEEVWLVDERGNRLRCDVLGVPRDPSYSDLNLAFECKRPDREWHYALWSAAMKQASDYVDAEITDPRFEKGKKVSGTFIFPAPLEAPSGPCPNEASPFVREGFEEAVAAMFHLASKYRVGRAGRQKPGNDESFHLNIGPNFIWRKRFGFARGANDLLRNKRPVGSRRK